MKECTCNCNCGLLYYKMKVYDHLKEAMVRRNTILSIGETIEKNKSYSSWNISALEYAIESAHKNLKIVHDIYAKKLGWEE